MLRRLLLEENLIIRHASFLSFWLILPTSYSSSSFASHFVLKPIIIPFCRDLITNFDSTTYWFAPFPLKRSSSSFLLIFLFFLKFFHDFGRLQKVLLTSPGKLSFPTSYSLHISIAFFFFWTDLLLPTKGAGLSTVLVISNSNTCTKVFPQHGSYYTPESST